MAGHRTRPALGRPYTDLIYRPMLELMEYLRANGYKTYIVTGGGPGRRMGMLVFHDEAVSKNWSIISMKNDWKKIFKFE